LFLEAAWHGSSAVAAARTMKQHPFFAQLFGPLFAGVRRKETAPPRPRTLHDVEGELEALSREAESRRLEAVTRAAEEGVANGARAGGLSEVSLTAARQRTWRRERDVRRGCLEEEIIDLHVRLGTGISEDALPRLRLLLAAHDPDLLAQPGASIEQQIEGSVLKLLSRHTGERAWERVNELMTRSAVSWPIPDGLAQNRSAGELEAAVSHHYEEARLDFVGASSKRLAGLVCGEVSAWAYCYPPRGSYLWGKTALCGVAAGLRAQLFAAALESWTARPPELEARLLETLDAELQAARRSFETGGGSLQAAVDAGARVDEACGTIAPALVWQFLEPRLSWEGSGPTVVSLAGLSHAA
jgi:hypothetical protein